MILLYNNTSIYPIVYDRRIQLNDLITNDDAIIVI